MADINVKVQSVITPAVQAKVRAGVPLHKAVAGAGAKATGPKIKVGK